MKTFPSAPANLQGSLRQTYVWLATATMLCVASTLTAQSVLGGGGPKAPLTPRIVQQDRSPDASSSDILSGPETETSSFELGQIRLRPQLNLRYMQVNGLPTGIGANTDSSVFTFAPGITAELGSKWIIHYSPTWTNYSASSINDSTSHSASVAGATKVNDWTFGFSESFQSSQDILAETATQTKQHNWSTNLTASRKVGQRSMYDGDLSLDERYGDDFPDSKTWSTEHWLRSQVTPKLNAGLGFNLTKTDFSSRDDMRSEEFMGSIRWQTTRKIDLSVQGGLESRHFDTAGVGTLRSPTMQITLGYRPFEQTRFTLASTRAVSNSFFSNQVTRNTGWSASLNQRLLEKLNLSMSYSDQTSDYKSFATVTLPEVRSDKFKSFNASLGIMLLKRWTLAAVYQSNKNTSSQGGFGFSTTQYGVELSGGF